MCKLIQGVNFGNWLVLEKWMSPDLFEPYGADDEIWLHRTLAPLELQALLKEHRDTYITAEDFHIVADRGFNLVRLPVPYFVFGDRDGHPGCIEYVDLAFDWAEAAGVQIMLDLHTVEGSQNGYDNGGITGVCKWCQNPAEVEFALTVLERLAVRYADRKGLYGIEVLNEPISWLVYTTAPSTGHARDKNEAKGSRFVPMSFLKPFYKNAYRRIRAVLPREKVIVFHDGFRLGAWKDFFVREGMENVILDTHIYIDAMELFIPVPALWIYRLFVAFNKQAIRKAARYTPVVVGEWNLQNRRAEKVNQKAATPEARKAKLREEYHYVANMEMDAWEVSAGHIYWNYQLERDHNGPERRKANGCLLTGWDLVRTWNRDWMPERSRRN